jgi:hypothetical protein
MLRRFTVHLVAAVAGVGVLAVCSETNSPVPRSTAQPSASELPAVGARGFTIMTRNLKFGGSLTEFAGSTDPVPVRWAKLWADVQAFDFPERAGTFAREIAETSPALVGLQEVPLFRTQTPSDGGTTPATGVLMDFLSILEDSLAARGLSYRVAAVNATTDVELPMLVAGTIDQYVDLRYIDRDVILARNDVATDDPNGAKYAARISLTLPGGTRVRSERGWVSTRATLGGVVYRIVSTPTTTASTMGSRGATPYRTDETTPSVEADMTRPTPTPIQASVIPCLPTSPTMAARRAPSAMRTPISRVRWATEYDTTP